MQNLALVGFSCSQPEQRIGVPSERSGEQSWDRPKLTSRAPIGSAKLHLVRSVRRENGFLTADLGAGDIQGTPPQADGREGASKSTNPRCDRLTSEAVNPFSKRRMC